MKVYFRRDPWESLTAIEPNDLGFSGDYNEVDGRGSPQVVIPFNNGGKPRFAGLLLPASSFPFKHKDTFYQNYHLPMVSIPGRLRQDVVRELYLNGSTFSIKQADLLGRPKNEKDHRIVSKRHEWMQWQIQRYMELADPTFPDKKFESVFQSKHVRRSWETVRSEWMRDEDNDSKISLIVKLAADEALLNALERITGNPRRILERYRQDTPISSIQELDAACLRDYARRPGRTTEEKAGTKQALLAVRRRERIDTLENMVTRWTIHRMNNLALEWLRQHEKYTGDSNERVQKVKKLSMLLRNWESRDSFMDNVPILSRHPNGPNYPLQFEKRYVKVWMAYVKIRQETKVYEDAWTWQRAMWPETGRQIFHSVLTEKWSEQGTSTPIYRPEGLNGDWLLPFRSPGPFKTPNGPALLFDSLDLHGSGLGGYWMEKEQFDSAHSIGKCGCEQALWFPEKSKGIAIWYAMVEPERISLEKITQDTRLALRKALKNNSLDQNWIGLVLAALIPDESQYLEKADIAHPEPDRDSIGVLIPMEVHRHARDVKAGIELAIEALEKIV